MEAHVELTRKRSENLADINTLLIKLSQWQVELRLVVLKDRLANAEKLKTRYQKQVDILFVESYRSGWENKKFEGHAEVVTLYQFYKQKGIKRDHYSDGYYMQELKDEINIVYPADVPKMLDEDNDRPSTSVSVAKEIVLVSDLPEQATEVPKGQPDPSALTDGGTSAVVLSSNDSVPICRSLP
ncbi:hypothetical protein PanWU01x14_318430 [Parasponia andersonii]|uniref:Uncharacterized protein n=1 Tax=Parasponia andersonii TaxID=3476 RepID=A0A2P5AMB0_PARAD|nr:hypothetical protein PanWU01x14_318430 [Parasponia andersonii]